MKLIFFILLALVVGVVIGCESDSPPALQAGVAPLRLERILCSKQKQHHSGPQSKAQMVSVR